MSLSEKGGGDGGGVVFFNREPYSRSTDVSLRIVSWREILFPGFVNYVLV